MGSGASKAPAQPKPKPNSTPSVNATPEKKAAPQSSPKRGQGFQEVKLQDPSQTAQNSHSPSAGKETQSNSNSRPAQNNSNSRPAQNNSNSRPAQNSKQSTEPSRKSSQQSQNTKPSAPPSESKRNSMPNQQRGSVSGGQANSRPSVQQSSSKADVNGNDDIVFETFYHNSGRVYTCLYRSGIRYYLDNWKTEEWQIFPMKWYNEGRLVTESLITGGQTIPVRQTTSSPSGSQNQSQIQSQSEPSAPPVQGSDHSAVTDDRESTIRHPTKGKLPTYIFEVRRNVNCYYDEEMGQWVKLPVGWELQSDMVGRLVDQVQEAIPEWKNRGDILAALRTCNYDLDDCIDTYFAWGQAGSPSSLSVTALNPPQKSGGKDSRGFADQMDKMEAEIKTLKQEVEKYRIDLNREKELRVKAEKQASEFQKKFTDLEAEAKVAIVQLEVMQAQQSRPKTARPKTPAPQVVKETVVEQTVDPQSVAITQKSAVALHKVYNGLKLDVQNLQKEVNSYMKKIAEQLKLIKAADQHGSGEIEELRSAYRKECIQRKQLYNQLQELRGNIRVFCRCRHDSRVECCLKFVSSEDIQAPSHTGQKKQFRFDKVYSTKSTQAEVFEDTLPIISSCVDGYNVCILAYGQTGSGKTYTMMGPENDPGVNIRSVRQLLKICTERENTSYNLKCSILEIYNETVQDLLVKESKSLDVRAHGKGIDIPGLTSMEVKSVDDIKTIMKLGDENRSVASTKMNSSSSRSHLVMMITVVGVDKVSKAQSTGILTMCDLAGSERISKTEATGQRLVEAAAINKSLTALGQVFSALRTNQLHVPYRNSKLTHILQPCLGGDAKVAMFVAVSPDIENVTETVSTLQYGSNARQVQLGQAKQNVKKPGPQ